ncbi:DoxX family protein [Capilliphycus salinus ALCB114379]|uniref:DoxX family protein n=1 Tax=Capilliphycus salinus TaxID=2768948 RepID=UPI0039A54465
MKFSETPILLRRQDLVLAYTLLRLVFGINFMVHGLVRIGDIPGFVASQVALYEGLPVPEFMIAIPAFFIPIVELIAGVLMIVGFKTRNAIIAGFSLMLPLMFGVCLLQKWDTASSQLIYCVVFFILLSGYTFNQISVDSWLRTRKN